MSEVLYKVGGISQHAVLSSNVMSIGYSSGVLQIEYMGGAVYRYYQVPWRVAGAVMRSDSKGKAINSLIKGKYEFARYS